MYQNGAPPAFDMNGGPPPPPQTEQQQYGGYPTYPNQQYGNMKAAYQQPLATQFGAAGVVAPNVAVPDANNNVNPSGGGGAVSSGLIRLTLRKPMGIVFEPTPDPHNPSQQRGVRICDLPRTGAAFLSGKLQVGDELLSINDKTMSRLTFDEIMDFIIVADKERVDLLFRRPTKEKQAQQAQLIASAPELGEVASSTLGQSQSNSVKWVDDGKKKKSKSDDRGGRRDFDMDVDEPRSRGGRGSSKGHSSKRRDERDEISVGDDTYDQYTVESQSQYTMETYEDERKGRRGGRGGDSRRNDRDRSRRDPIESGGFLDLLIDTLCTSVIGRDPYNRSRGGKSKYDDYDDDQTYDDQTYDDGTYVTYEENDRSRRRRKDDSSYATEDDGTMATEDDGTRTLETNEDSYVDRRKERIRQNFRAHQKMEKKEVNPVLEDDEPDEVNYLPPNLQAPVAAAPDPPTVKPAKDEEESAVDTLHVPLKELNFDELQDYAADVSVMESLGGPSLLVERARLENAVTTGAGLALRFENLEKHDPELAKLVAVNGDGFECEPGMSKEEAVFRDPYAFYEHAVTNLLRDNEPEKVRLLSKLMAKYKGRERHLIHKLSARYKKEGGGDGLETKTSGMEKINEGEEDAGSLNDPSRANVDAIEVAKKKMESDDNWGDGWPPAMSDPWGGANEDAAARDSEPQNAGVPAAPAGDESRPLDEDDSYSDASSYTGDSGLDGTSPAVIAQVSELLNYVYGKTSVAGQIDRVSTIMRAYEGREAVLLELLETKALIKANADTTGDASEIPMSLRENPGLNMNSDGGGTPATAEKPAPQTPVSALTGTTGADYSNKKSPAKPSPKKVASPSEATTASTKSDKKKKKKGILGGIFGSSKKKDKKGNFPTSTSKKGQQLNDDGSI